MPGFEVIDKTEKKEILSIFNKGGGVLFRQGFENLRNNSFKVNKFEQEFKKKFNCKYALGVTSGTSALRIALACKKIGKGDEVITQSFTFVATVESIVESGAKPICTEIDSTLNMCVKDLKKKITKKTKAVIVVHMLGVPAEMTKIRKICKNNNQKFQQKQKQKASGHNPGLISAQLNYMLPIFAQECITKDL